MLTPRHSGTDRSRLFDRDGLADAPSGAVVAGLLDTLACACRMFFSVTHEHTHVLALCPHCGHEMYLHGEYDKEIQVCPGCNAHWTLIVTGDSLAQVGWVYIAPDDPSLIPPTSGPFAHGN